MEKRKRRIKIEDLARYRKIRQEEMKMVLGGLGAGVQDNWNGYGYLNRLYDYHEKSL